MQTCPDAGSEFGTHTWSADAFEAGGVQFCICGLKTRDLDAEESHSFAFALVDPVEG